MATIFISYRRSDSAGHAGRLYDQLVQRFGKANVFKDLDSMKPGADFAQVIEEAVTSSDALLAVIGRDWVSPRLTDPDDWVRLEIAHALARDVRVVPILVEGAKMPAPSDLPADLSALTRRHAVDLSETGWHAQVEELLDRLEAAVRGDETVSVDDLMANFTARLQSDPSGKALAYQLASESGPDRWRITVLTNTEREREFELWFRDWWSFPISLRRGRWIDKVTVEGANLPCKSAKPAKYGLLAAFTLRTPVGQASGLLNWKSSFSRIVWASVYVDGEPVYLESPGPLPAEAWPEQR
jgi:TIR domain